MNCCDPAIETVPQGKVLYIAAAPSVHLNLQVSSTLISPTVKLTI